MISMKALKIILCVTMIGSCLGLGIVDMISPNANWKTPVLAVLYGAANIIIFVCKN